MSKFQITFVFDKNTDEVTDLQVIAIDSKTKVQSGSFVNSNAKIELKGSSLVLNDDILKALKAKIDSKLVLTVDSGKASLGNPKLNSTLKGGNKVTGKQTISCRGAVKDALEAIGTTFAFKVISNGVIELIPVTDDQEVLQVTEETDSVISTEDIESLYNNDGEETTDDFNFDI